MVAIRRRVMRGLYEGFFFYVYLILWDSLGLLY